MSYFKTATHKKYTHILFLMSFMVLIPCIASAGVAIAPKTIGVAKTSSHTGRAVTLSFFVESFSANPLSQVILIDDLDAVFGAGNYSVGIISQASGPSTLTINSMFDGSGNTVIISGGSLLPGETAQIDVNVDISAFVDLGMGLGMYSNQANITALDNGIEVSDLSDFGTNPDPNGNNNPTESGENDPTLIDLTEQPELGVAKSASISGNTITLDFRIKNFGNRTLQSISLIDDLDTAFGAGNYTILSAPTFVNNPGTITLNSGFNGSSNKDLITSGTLAIGDDAQIQIQLRIDTVVDLGMGNGAYQNQAQVSGQTATGTIVTDLSDDGTNPDPNGNNNPNEDQENDPTIIVLGEDPVIGVAKTVNVAGNSITFDVYLENLGNSTLSDLSVTDNLNSVFGAGNYFVSSAPAFIDDPGTLTLNTSFNGNANLDLISGGSLAAGDTAQIRFVAQLLTLTDQGLGLGNYENQILASATAPGGGITQDLSDNGTDPDPNGNANPSELNEDDPTAFNVASLSSIGIAKRYVNIGNSGGFTEVELHFTVTNYGNRTINNISISEDLNAVYGAGNFIHQLDPTFISGINSLNYNSAFNGNTNTAMLTGGSLEPGESVTFKIRHLIVSLTDQGFGTGIYHNQVTAIGTAPDASPVSDLSHAGSNPDENGNGNPGDDQDVTIIDLNVSGAIGIANNATVAGNVVTFDLFLENLGTLALNQISIDHMLASVFGEGNYTIISAPSLTDDPGTLVLNSGFDGFNDNKLLNIASSSLTGGDTANIRFQVSISPITNQGLGVGSYSSQTTVNALTSLGGQVNDISDNGTDPDPNGNGNANEAGENDVTTISIGLDTPLGVAKTVSVAGSVVTVDLYLENLGASTLSAVDLQDNLDAVFGASNYQLTSPPTLIADPGTLVLNGAFNGSTNSSILATGSTLAGGATAQIQFVVNVITESDQGNGFGVYSNQALVKAMQPNGLDISDLSDDGTDPDPNGNGDPSDAGEDDPSVVIIAGNPAVAIAKKATVQGTQVILDFYIENIGNSTLSNVRMEDQLNPVFGSGNYSVSTRPSLVSGPGTLTRSGNYFGFSVFDVIIGGGFLRPGETEVVRTIINITNVTDQGDGLGVYLNSVTINATGPDGTPVMDVSDDGIVPNPNGTGSADETGENDSTRIIIGDEANIGLATTASVSGQQVTFDIYLENLGASTLNTFSLIDNLDNLFGAGNYTLNSGPIFIDDPGSITLNGGFDGSGTTQLITSGDLAGGDTAQIQLVVTVTNPVDQGLGLGNYSQLLSVTASAPLGTIGTDFSDNGTDPDPNGNGNPQDTNESDPTTFTVEAASIGIAKQATLDSTDPTNSTVIFDFVITNLGTSAITSVSVTDDLDSVFGIGNYAISSAPAFTSAGRDLSPNTGFNGSSDKNLIIPGATLTAAASIDIQMKVRITNLVDQGFGLGVYENQAQVSGLSANMAMLSDLSDAGLLPDPDGDGMPDGADEDDPTQFSLSPVPPAFSMVFNPDVINLSGTTKLIYSVDNSQGLFAVNSLAFNNNLPTELSIAGVPNLVNSCGGTVTASAGSHSVIFIGGAVTANMNCTISIDVVASQAGVFINTSGDLTSTSGNSGPASDTLTVDGPPVITPPANINTEATGQTTAVMLGTATVTDDFSTGLLATPNTTGPFPLGATIVTWSATDTAGNTGTAIQTVTIVDTTPPVVTPPGAINQEATGTTTAVAIGTATVTDLVNSGLVATPSTAGPFPIGPTTVTWSATDLSTNTGTANQIITIVDTTAPIISLTGADPLTLSTGDTFTDPGATATDLVDGVVTGGISATGTVNTAVPATYTITYSVTDIAGNTGTATRSVIVNDGIPPVVTPPANIVQEATSQTTPVSLGTATVTDDVDTGLTATPSTTGPFPLGTTTVTWTATDTGGNVGSAAQTVTIIDTTLPVVIPPADINQEATGTTTSVTLGTATVTDLAGTILVATPDITGPFALGTTVITWTATDAAGNSGIAIQNVRIVDTTPPTLTVTGTNPVILDIGDSFTDQGATANDLVDGNISASITVTNPVNTALPGTYLVSYSATDNAGNTGTIIRTVFVQVQTARTFSALLPSGNTGTLSFSSSDPGCTFNGDPVFINTSAATIAPPTTLDFTDGLISFEINQCGTGASVIITMDYGQPVASGAGFWKQDNPWFQVPATVSGNTISFQITDGGLGDADGVANGVIRDPGGAAVDTAASGSSRPIPTLSEWALILMALMMLSMGIISRRNIH